MTDRRNKNRYRVKDKVMVRIVDSFKKKLIASEKYKSNKERN